MKTQFTPIAMKCNQEQFEAIKPKLNGKYTVIWCFSKYNYLCNNFDNKKMITNISKENETFAGYKVYEEWNEQTFLNACRIPTYTLTKEQLTYLHSVDVVKEQIEEWFPEFKKPILEVGKWYKSSLYAEKLYCFTSFKNREFSVKRYYYGFNDGEWVTSWIDSNELDKSWSLATPQEVEEALTKEAVKRGFKEGVIFNAVSDNGDGRHLKCKMLDNEFSFFDNKLSVSTPEYTWTYNQSNPYILKDGVWAEIIENTLLSDIEQLSLKYGKEALIKILSDDK